MKIAAIIIAYNSLLENSHIIEQLKKNVKHEIVVIDNGTKEYVEQNNMYSKLHNITYYPMHCNVGLSKAYNFAISNVEADYYILFDDDTIIDDDFISKVIDNINSYDADLYFPLVYNALDKEKIVRPYILKKWQANIFPSVPLKCVTYDKIEEFEKSKHLKTINSGMIIKKSEDVHFNEKLFLGFIDVDFIERMLDKNKKIKIIDVSIYQDFSEDIVELESYKNRYDVVMPDFIEYYNWFVLFRSVIAVSLKFKTLYFLGNFFKLIFKKDKVA